MTTADVPVHVAKKEKESSFYLSCLSSSFPSINVISSSQLHYTTVIINTSLSLSKAQDIVPSRTFPFMEAKSQVATEHAEGQQQQCSADTIRMGFQCGQNTITFLRRLLVATGLTEKAIYTPELTVKCSVLRGSNQSSTEQKLNCNSAIEWLQRLPWRRSGRNAPLKLSSLETNGPGTYIPAQNNLYRCCE